MGKFYFLLNYWFIFIPLFISSYLIGSINFSIIVSKIIKNDIRNLGSKNAGFSNVLRSFGILPGVITFLGDFLKGFLVAGLGKFILSKFILDKNSIIFFLYFVVLACLLGHLFPFYFNFKGGKGILTTWAMSFFLNWKIFTILIIVFLITLLISRIVSLASVTVVFLYPIVNFLLYFQDKCFISFSTFFSLLISIIILLKHKQNIKRLFKGNEKKMNVKNIACNQKGSM